jgi:hypothetical protein
MERDRSETPGIIVHVKSTSTPESEAKPRETLCPFCTSPKVAHNPKQSSSYYRCEACGQVWHPDRLRPGIPDYRRWR